MLARLQETRKMAGDWRRGRKHSQGHKGEQQRGTQPRLAFGGGQTPFYIQIQKYEFNEGHHSFRCHYQPLSLNRLQYLIDLLVNGRCMTIQPLKRDYVNIGVRLASELAIVAIEKNGSVVTMAFYDPRSLEILYRPVLFFLHRQPIPKQMLPSEALIPYYTDAKSWLPGGSCQISQSKS
ncbi:unnamed protein product [Nyctereutes procyonoides]|uniref:(raccoon dog) hypothetical protein n=1 Tax=Nyctereutes procyonoides TaxID=34880 RepID=A0A811Y9L5_NYCPR|nr:unnamed protein product [Nyctereutes procyonoides]